MASRTRSPKKHSPLPGQLSLFGPYRPIVLPGSRRDQVKRDERIRAIKACFGWWARRA